MNKNLSEVLPLLDNEAMAPLQEGSISPENPVMMMAKALKAEISKQGGAKAIWNQIDPIFKAVEGKNQEDKESNSPSTVNKISWKAFEKAFERLDNPDVHKHYEKMEFGIKGNPFLLANILKTLNIGISDLIKYQFTPPNINTAIYSIETKVDELNIKLDDAIDKIELYSRKRSRFTLLKVAADLSQILKRLTTIIINNKDDYVDSVKLDNYFTFYNNLIKSQNNEINGQHFDIKGAFEKLSMINFQTENNKFFTALTTDVISKYTGNDKTVLYLLNIIFDFREYSYSNELLSKESRYLIKDFSYDVKDIRGSSIYLSAPLYCLMLFLFITLMYIGKIKRPKYEKIKDELNDTYLTIKKENTGLNEIENYTRDIIKIIEKLIRKLEILYSQYQFNFSGLLLILKKIVSLYSEIFQNDTTHLVQQANISSLSELFQLKLLGVSENYTYNEDIKNKFLKLRNDLSKSLNKISRYKND